MAKIATHITLSMALLLLATLLLFPAHAQASEPSTSLIGGQIDNSKDQASPNENGGAESKSKSYAKNDSELSVSIDYSPAPYGYAAILTAVPGPGIGSSMFTYRWEYSSDAGSTWQAITSSAPQVLQVTASNPPEGHLGHLFRVVLIVGPQGEASYQEVVSAPVAIVAKSSFLIQLDYIPPYVGETAVFTARVFGANGESLDDSDVEYQWQQSTDDCKTWLPIPNESGSTLRLPTNPNLPDAGSGGGGAGATRTYIRFVAVLGSLSAVSNAQLLTVRVPEEGGGSSEEQTDGNLISISKASISGIVEMTYNGKPQTHEISVKIGETTLEQGKDYTVEYSNNVNAGYGRVDIKGIGKYKDGTSVFYKINPAKVTIAVSNASKIQGETDPAFSGTIKGLVAEGDLGKVSYRRTNTDETPGTYKNALTAEYAPNSNYDVSIVNGDFAITAKSAEKATLTFDLAGGTLDGKTGNFTISANVGSTIKLPNAPAREGYTFKCWKGSEYEAGAKYKVEGDHTFTAAWTKKSPSGTSSKSSSGTTRASSSSTSPKTGDTTSEAIVALAVTAAAALCLTLFALSQLKRRSNRRNPWNAQ